MLKTTRLGKGGMKPWNEIRKTATSLAKRWKGVWNKKEDECKR